MKKFVFCLTTLFVFNSLHAQWVRAGLDSVKVKSLGISGTNLFAGTNDCGIYISTNNGSSWNTVNNGLSKNSYDTTRYTTINSFAVNMTHLFVGSLNGVFHSTNNGTSWTAINAGLPSNTGIYSLTKNGNDLFVGTIYDGIYHTSNNGALWNATNMKTPFGRVFSSGSSDIFASYAGTGLFVSHDNGAKWDSLYDFSEELDYAEISDMVISDSLFYVSVNGTYGNPISDGGSLYYSSNRGITWNENGRISHIYISVINVIGDNVIVGTSAGVYISNNNGLNWRAENTGLPKDEATMNYNTVYALTITGPNIFVGTSRGIYRRPLSEMITSVEQSSSQLPENYSLSQNYPNPFNPSTKITYTVPEQSTVRLSIFNTLGQKISEIVNETKDVGSYEHSFNASQLSSGIYFYRIEATSTQNAGKTFVETKKMVLIR